MRTIVIGGLGMHAPARAIEAATAKIGSERMVRGLIRTR
jgi:hypothetical protein